MDGTPACASVLVLPLRRGSVAGLTPAQVRALTHPDERLASISVFDAAAFVRPCAQSHLPLSHFVGLDDFAIFLVPRSSVYGLHTVAPSTSGGIVGDHESGRATVTPAMWHEMTRTLRPTFAVALHDSVALSEATSARRRRNTLARNEAWAKATRALDRVPCRVLWPASLLLLADAPAAAATEAASLPSAAGAAGMESAVGCAEGCYMDLLPCNENSYEYARGLRAAAALCDGSSMCQALSLVAVLAALHAGVRYIESPLPWALAEKGVALVVRLPERGTTTLTPASNRSSSDNDGNDDHGSSDDDVLMELSDTRYALDTRPLCDDCTCYTCRRHHRAYVHHLLSVCEMNSTILLSLHNLARLLELVRRHRQLTSAADRAAYVASVLSQC